MISDRSVRAGTVLHFDFKVLRGVSPEFFAAHPAVVISPTARQKDRTLVVVPLTSEVSNAGNPSAVEIFHAELNRRSPTGRTFAVCNLPVALALKRPSLHYYRREVRPASEDEAMATGDWPLDSAQPDHAQPHYELRGEDLGRIRAKVVEHFYTAAGLRTDAELRALIGADRVIHARANARLSLPLPPVRIKATPKMVLKSLIVDRINGGGPARPLLRSIGPLLGNPRPVGNASERGRRQGKPIASRPLH